MRECSPPLRQVQRAVGGVPGNASSCRLRAYDWPVEYSAGQSHLILRENLQKVLQGAVLPACPEAFAAETVGIPGVLLQNRSRQPAKKGGVFGGMALTDAALIF